MIGTKPLPGGAIPPRRRRTCSAGAVPMLTQYLRIALRWKWLIIGSIAAPMLLASDPHLADDAALHRATRLEIQREANRVVNVEDVEPETAAVDMEFYQTQYGLLRSRSLAERVARDLRLSDDPPSSRMFGENETPTPRLGNGRLPRPRRQRDRRSKAATRSCCEHLRSRRSGCRGSSTSASPAPIPNSLGAGRERLGARLHRDHARAALRGDLLCAPLPRGAARAAARPARRIRAAAGRLCRRARGSSTFRSPAARPAQSPGTVDRRRQPRRAQLASSPGDRRPDPGAKPLRSARRARSREALTNHGDQRAAPAPRRGGGRICPADDPVRARLSAGAGAGVADRAARPEHRARGSAGAAARSAEAYSASVERERSSRAGRGAEGRASSTCAGAASSTISSSATWTPTASSMTACCSATRRSASPAASASTTSRSSIAAQVPRPAVQPRPLINLLLALLAGLAVGVGLALALEQIDEAIADPTELEKQARPAAARARFRSRQRRDPIGELRDPQVDVAGGLSVGPDQPRLLDRSWRAADRWPSPARGPPKARSTTAYRASPISLARSGARTLLVDGDMRSPSVHHRSRTCATSGASATICPATTISRADPDDRTGKPFAS